MKKYEFSKIEKRWQTEWKKTGIYEPSLKSTKTAKRKPFYNLMMFPYPSAEGLHVGNMYAFVGSDIYGRFKRMGGYDVFEPIGLDGFGIHSENYAIKVGTHPLKQSKVSEKRFYKQLEMIGNGFAWNEHLETYDPEYYRWTQWVFIAMWKRGLAYRKKQAVNWCPSCKTVLADEQVVGGACERCSSVVIKKELEQWSFRITRYADRLLKNLDHIDWSERVKIAQRNWIGKSEGAEINFKIANSEHVLKVFTTRPDTLFGATYMVVAPEHEIISKLKSQISNYSEVEKYVKISKEKSEEERVENKEKTGIELKGIKAINPANKKEIPIFAADYVLSGYGTGAIMAVPAHDERDFDFAKKFKLPIVVVISDGKTVEPLTEAYIGDGELINSGPLNGLSVEDAKKKITNYVGGTFTTQFRLRDWIVSRQRYWSPPIPMMYCEACARVGKGEQKEMPGWYAEKEKNLPVLLPMVKEFRPKGKDESPLASVKSFYKVGCPVCGGGARRETDVSDTFLDSAWYFLRYPSVQDRKSAWNNEITKKWLPVHMYIGGAEHSVLHLLYSRFITMVFKDAGLIDFEEPFTRFRAHGLLIKEGAKMSKSKGNVVNPDEYIKRFGADTLRTNLMFLAPFEQGGDFRDAGIVGVARFIERVWRLGQTVIEHKNKKPTCERAIHKAIKKVTEDIESLQYNTAISALMICLNEIENKEVSVAEFQMFLQLLAPFAPHMTEELWFGLGNKKSIHISEWPVYDPKKIVEENFVLVVQINGKVRATIEVPRGISENDAKKIAMSQDGIKKMINGIEIKKIIFVPNRLINLVI
ncbi:MAG: leucyl-tRNA synthetase [Parcubacteria group bacterium LiPW_41]|nr:MAG: leucyl-tRNA synthetase [Parcubacteria group bacterium LiPW_41]